VGSGASQIPAWAFSDSAFLTLERDRLFRPSWQLLGHEADIPRVGDYVAVDLAGERVLVVRSSEDRIQAFRNTCRKRPHALLMDRGGRLSRRAGNRLWCLLGRRCLRSRRSLGGLLRRDQADGRNE